MQVSVLQMFLTWLIYVPELQITYSTLHPILTNFENIVQRSHRFLSHFFHLITQKDISTYTAKQLQKAILLQHLDGISTLMEKSFTNRASFPVIKKERERVSFHQVLNIVTILKAA